MKITLEELLAERRPTPFVDRIPYAVQQRRGRRDGIRLLKRSTTSAGEEFQVAGKTGTYAVIVGLMVSCSCPDDCSICKHLSFVYLDVLNLNPTNPRTWQTCLLSHELSTLFPSSAPSSKKRALSHPPPTSAKRARPLPPISTEGITDASFRPVLLYVLQVHPEAASHVEARRETLLDGISHLHARQVLGIVGGEYEDVGNLIRMKIALDNEPIESFDAEVRQAEAAMTSLDHLSPRWQFERSGEVSAGITTAISDILERVNSHSAKGTKLAAIQALISIGLFMMRSMDGEIGKCIQSDYTPTELSNAVAKVVHMMEVARA